MDVPSFRRIALSLLLRAVGGYAAHLAGHSGEEPTPNGRTVGHDRHDAAIGPSSALSGGSHSSEAGTPRPTVPATGPGLAAYLDLFVDRQWRVTVLRQQPAEIARALGLVRPGDNPAQLVGLEPAESEAARDYTAAVMAITALRELAEHAAATGRFQSSLVDRLVSRNALLRLRELAEEADGRHVRSSYILGSDSP